MKTISRILTISAITAITATLALNAIAADKKAHTFSEWSLGETVFGDAISTESIKGKVVVLEYWGVRCPPCIASLPHLAKLDKKYRDDGLIMIGAESQLSSKEQMEPLIKKAKVDYTITKGARGPIQVSGIPRILVFNRAGQMIFDGNPADRKFEKTVRSALKEDPPAADKDIKAAADKDTKTSSPNLIDQRSWTNSEGNTIRAAVRKADETTVTFIMTNGRSVNYPVENLSEESKSLIEDSLKGRQSE